MERWNRVRGIFVQPRWNYYILILLAFCMPFYNDFLPYLITAALLSWMIQKNIVARVKSVSSFKYFIFVGLFYVLHLLGLLYTRQLDEGIFDVQLKLSLIIFPLIIFSSSDFLVRRKDIILSSFIYGNLAASIICIIIAVYHSFRNGAEGTFNVSVWPFTEGWPLYKLIFSGYSYFNYTWLSVFIHAGYFSMYILFSLYIVYSRLILRWEHLSLLNRMTSILLICFFLFMILLLQSRAAIIALAAVFIFEMSRMLLKKGKFGLKTAIIVFFALIITAIVQLSTRFDSLKIDESGIKISRENDFRLLMWAKSVNIIKSHILFGVGTGDEEPAIRNVYDAKLMEVTKGKKYNCHNVYLETTMKLGIIGGGLLLVILFLPFFRRVNYYKERLLLGFLIIIMVHFFFESMLSRLNGVVFFSFFYCLLVSGQKNIPESESSDK